MPQGRKSKNKKKDPQQKRHGYAVVVDSKGFSHAFVNAAFPTKNGAKSTSTIRTAVESLPSAEGVELAAPLHTAICDAGCNHAYAHLMEKHANGIKTCQCDECRLEQAALRAIELQEEAGISLGWKASGLVDRRDSLSMADAQSMHVIRRR